MTYENKQLEKWSGIDLILDQNNEEKFLTLQNFFIKNLEKNYNSFILKKEDLKKEDEAFKNKIEKEKKIFYDFDFSWKNSPLTIFDAPWGAGKSYFFDSLIKNIIDEKVNFEKFKNIILIDVWKYSFATDIPSAVLSELFDKLSQYDAKMKLGLANFLSKTFNIALNPWIKKIFNIELNKIENPKKDKKVFDIKIEPTIIILDNIERLGDKSWELLKAIFQLQKIENLLFILPMNKDQLIHEKNLNNNEYQIEKFVDMPYYEFKQNYFGLLSKNIFSNSKLKRLIPIFNSILNLKIGGSMLSIREAEKKLKILDEVDIGKNKYYFLKFFSEKIWGAFSEVKKYIEEDFFILKKYYEEIEKRFEKVKKEYFLYDLFEQVIQKGNYTTIDSFNSNNIFFKKYSSFIYGSSNFQILKKRIFYYFMNKSFEYDFSHNYLFKFPPHNLTENLFAEIENEIQEIEKNNLEIQKYCDLLRSKNDNETHKEQIELSNFIIENVLLYLNKIKDFLKEKEIIKEKIIKKLGNEEFKLLEKHYEEKIPNNFESSIINLLDDLEIKN